ncbi:MAG TPA: efflux RND transporter periplasmic adaptor subunit [Opitutaceae bacterium]|nr:efflux RND transporter periplasmic adaptor subunit [Opitutaceae bacterium]
MKKVLYALMIVGLAVGVWEWVRRGAESGPDDAKPVAQVQVAPLRTGPIVDSLRVFGLVEPAPSGSRTVVLAYDAVVGRIAISPGAYVSKGDLLMEVEATPDAMLAMDSAKSSARVAQAELAAARQRYDLRLATAQEVLVAEQAAGDAAQRLGSLEARGQAGDGRVTAPGSGIVTRLDAQPGTVIAAGTPLVTIAESGQLEAHFAAEAADVGRIRAGQAVTVTPVDRPENPASSGAIRSVGASVDPVSGAVDLRATLAAGTTWFAGEHVQGAIHLVEKTALVAPRSAVLPQDGQQVLFTVRDSKAVRHIVKAGISTDDLVEVISGDLRAGDSAVVVGNYELEDGMDVQVSPGDPKGEVPPGPEKAP